MPNCIETEGILLATFPYLQEGRIVKFFTPSGILSFFLKKLSHKKAGSHALLSPLSEMELHYFETKNKLFFLKDFSSLNLHLDLRKSFSHLQSAGKMAKALLNSQMPEKRAPFLYSLFSKYLQKLPEFKNPEILSSSFYLKILIHEGLLSITPKCFQCAEKSSGFSQGESGCFLHAKKPFIYSEEHWLYLQVLALGKKFSDFQKVSSVPKSIENLFSHLIA